MLVRVKEAADARAAAAERAARDASAAAAEREAAAREREAATAEREAAKRAAGMDEGKQVLQVEGLPPLQVTAEEVEGLAYAVIGFQEMMQELREEIASLRKERDVHEARMRAQGMDKCFECQGSAVGTATAMVGCHADADPVLRVY